MAKKKQEENNTTASNEEIEKNTKAASRDMFMEYGPFLIAIVFILAIRIFIASPFRVDGTSMMPTLQDGNYMLLYKLKKRINGINRFDIVVVDYSEGQIIKRVIGLPKETIKYEVKEEDGTKKGILYVDGKVVEENFIEDDYKAATCIRNTQLCDQGITLGEDEYFVMGDNRAVSLDSRVLGVFNSKKIKGIAELRLFPFNKFGNVSK